MNHRVILILTWLLLLCHQVCSRVDFTTLLWKHNEADEQHVLRLAGLMRGIVTRAEKRFEELTRVKTAVDEESLDQRRAFEKGYVMGDIIETYRKALVNTQKQLVQNKDRYLEQDRMRFLTYVQNAYIKVYHLVHMMHEVNPKFGSDNTGQITQMNLGLHLHSKTPRFDHMAGFNHAKALNDIREERHRERDMKIEREKKMRLMELEVDGTLRPGTIKKTTNWWPVAYGWDIDYYW